MTDAWKHPWADTVWHSPSGREIHHEAGDELHEVELVLPDGTSRYHHYAGPAPVGITVDGERWTREAP